MDLLLNLRADLTRQAAVEDALREAIVERQLKPGAPLPSTRTLAAELGLARGTIVAAIEQLSAEGLLETRQGAPSRVAHVPPRPSSAVRTGGTGGPGGTPDAQESPERRDAPVADFYAGDPDLTLFPRPWWTSAVRSALDGAEADALGYGAVQGSSVLRTALTEYLGRTRGVLSPPDRVVVTAGFLQSLAVLGRALVAAGHRSVAVEDPSFWRHRELLADAGLECVGVPVDKDGISIDDLCATGARAVLVTPGHHTPLGVSLSPPRRAALAAWADEHDAVVIEDDYDGELRYDRRPLRALQSLDPARVVYCGSASKSLAPGLRLAWCVMPQGLLPLATTALSSIGGPSVSVVEQLALAEVLGSGRYDQQVRKVRAEYRRRRDQLVMAVGENLPTVRVEGIDAGLKALLRLPRDGDEAAVVDHLARNSVAVAPLSAYQIDRAPSPGGPAIVANYGRPYGHQYRTALTSLVDALRTHFETSPR